VDEARPPRVLLGNLEPILAVGLRRVLAEDGIDVIGQEETPSAIVTEARRLQPDVVLLNLDSLAGGGLGEQIQHVAPGAKVILWARDETVMEVLDPSCADARLVAIAAGGELRHELTSNPHRHREEDD
jgi:DNA-binding NarL/FixJ family response regulator